MPDSPKGISKPPVNQAISSAVESSVKGPVKKNPNSSLGLPTIQVSDRYRRPVLNRVMKYLGQSLKFRPGRGHHLASQKDRHTGAVKQGIGPQTSTLRIRQGQMVPETGKGFGLRKSDFSSGPFIQSKPKGSVPQKGISTPVLPREAVGNPRPSKMSQGGQKTDQEPLNLFEKRLMDRFAGGEHFYQAQPKDRKNFAHKEGSQWNQFFGRLKGFLKPQNARLAKEGESPQTPSDRLLKSAVYRGFHRWAQKPGQKIMDKGLMIADFLFLQRGKERLRVDKFAQVEVEGEALLKTLMTEYKPGQSLEPSLIERLFGFREFSYQSLSFKLLNPESAEEGPFSQKENFSDLQGLKSSEKNSFRLGEVDRLLYEKQVKENVKMEVPKNSLENHQDRSSGQLLVGGKNQEGSSLFGGRRRRRPGSLTDLAAVFVPWHQWIFSRNKDPRPIRWWIPLIYFTGFSISVLGMIHLFKRFF